MAQDLSRAMARGSIGLSEEIAVYRERKYITMDIKEKDRNLAEIVFLLLPREPLRRRDASLRRQY